MENTDSKLARHPIQVVSRRTGLSVDVIRVWERRYGLVEPHRAGGGRRLYSDADIRRLSLLQRATRGGRRISDLAGLAEAELAALVAGDQQAQATASEGEGAGGQGGVAAACLAACLSAIEELDPPALEQALSDASVALSIPDLLEQVIAPTLEQVGERWERGRARVSHEHFATAAMRSFLGGLVATANANQAGPVLLVATPVGQNHEIGALMAAVLAATDGWRVIYLASNLPARDLAAAAEQQQATAICLGVTYPADDSRLPGELRSLRRSLRPGTGLIVGGKASAAYGSVLEEIEALTVADLGEFRAGLRSLRVAAR
ncbi:MAG: MerR family transcriptional regulator [Gammaproteobacteria bacterium]|nr:MerR family transcriptional regulator [Gammaproteobacteria bacterium]